MSASRLSLRPVPPSGGDVIRAGWLPSAATEDWLTELANCERQGRPVAAYPVAVSVADPRPAGVFLVPLDGRVAPAFGQRVQPLKELLPGVYGPLEARLSAGVLEDERRAFFPYPIHFFHPALGVTGFDETDRIRPARLLRRPEPEARRWNLAIPATPFQPELEGFSVAEPPATERFLEEAADDIGSEASLPDEGADPGPPGGGFLRKILGKHDPKNPGSIGNTLRRLAGIPAEELVNRRQKAIEQLMALLGKDPDAGLRQALPLAGDAGRGAAPPSWTLGSRDLNFSHSSGRKRHDHWSLDSQQRINLEKLYRDAARREVALGRFDRAAYIYGNLLGDWAAAARTLAEADRLHEAVQIYLHKLNDRAAAARTLENAGLLLQAAGMYAELKQYEKAGDLHAQMGDERQARELYQLEVAGSKDALHKARVLAEKLDDSEAALNLLDVLWLSGRQTDQAVAAIFEIFRKKSDARAARNAVRRLFEPETPPASKLRKLTLAHEHVSRWPEPGLVAEYERQAYRCLAKALDSRAKAAKEFLGFLPNLAPHDELLARDALRARLFAAAPASLLPPDRRSVPKLQRTVQLDAKIDWTSLNVISLAGVSAAGCAGSSLAATLLIGGSELSLSIPLDFAAKGGIHHLVLPSKGLQSARLFHLLEQDRLRLHVTGRPATEPELQLCSLQRVLAISRWNALGDFLILQHSETAALNLHFYSSAGVLRSTEPLAEFPQAANPADWRMASRDSKLAIANAQTFLWRNADLSWSVARLSLPPLKLDIHPGGEAEALLCTEDAVTLFTGIRPGKPIEAVNLHEEQVVCPKACYLPDGSIAIAGGGAGVILPPNNRLEPSATFRFPYGQGLVIEDISPRGDGGFAVLTSDGKVALFE